jgi:hypothetical protein
LFTARFDGGVIGVFEATRFATGHKNAMRIEVSGSLGSLSFDCESLNELSFYDGSQAPDTAGFRRILVTEPTHPYLSGWWPPGHLIGYEHSFTHEIKDFVEAVGTGTAPEPSFADGLRTQLVLAAVAESAAADSVWTRVPEVKAAANPNRLKGSRFHDPSRHALHRPVRGPSADGGVPTGRGLGLRRPRTRLLGRPLRGRQGA